MRRSFIIAGIIALLAAGAYVGYVFLLKKTPDVVVAPIPTLPIVEPGNVPAAQGETPFVATSSPVSTSRFVKVSAGPVVSGMAAVYVKPKDASSTPDIDLRFIERRSGNVYSYLVRSHVLTRLSNRTIPGIQSASWNPSGTLALVRYLSGPTLSVVNTYALPSNGSGGFFLAQNLSGSSVSSTTILTLASGVNGSIASAARTDGTRVTQAFSTPLSQLLVSFLGKSGYLTVTKASAATGGYAYAVSGAGEFSRLAGPLPGLSALASPSGKLVLVSYADSSGLHTDIVNAATGELMQLPVATLSEKCVWTSDDASVYCAVPVAPASASYPDDWYQGAVSLNDRIWKISVAGRYTQLVLNLEKESNATFDVQSIAIDSSSSVLAFVNKSDGSLWSYEL